MPVPQNFTATSLALEKPTAVKPEYCFHCLEKLPKFCNIQADISGVNQTMCCYGCKAAAEYISRQNLAEFYVHRERSGLRNLLTFGTGSSSLLTPNQDWAYLDTPETASNYVSVNNHGGRELSVQVNGLYCSSCSWLINKALKRLSNNIQVQVELDAKRVNIVLPSSDSSIKLSSLVQRISHLGYQPQPLSLSPDYDDLGVVNLNEKHQFIKRIMVSGFGMMQVMTYAVALYLGEFQGMDEAHRRFLTLVSMLVATVVVFYSGKPFFGNALNDLKNRHFGMDVPIALAIGGAFFPSVYNTLTHSASHVYFDSAVMFIFFLTIGRFVEMRARHRLTAAPAALMRLLPSTVEVDRFSTKEVKKVSITPRDVQLRDQLVVHSGDVVPFDARVCGGDARVDESLLTGEALAVTKSAGDYLLAGSRLQSGLVSIEATRLWPDSSIVKIERLLQAGRSSSSSQFSNLQSLSQVFVIAVLVLTFAVGCVWWFYQAERAFDIVLAMLIASCPCAFALAIPIGQAAASYTLRQCGILLAKPNALNMVSQVSTWCFDKTGTLTQGRTSINTVSTLSERSENECLQIMAALEQQSGHVLANAFAAIETNLIALNVREYAGNGLSGTVDGQAYWLGKLSWVAGKVGAQAFTAVGETDSGSTEFVLASDSRLLAIVSVSDELRSGSEEYLNFLNREGKRSIILSGDAKGAVDAWAQVLLVDEALANLLPEQKLDYLKAKQAQGEKLAMLGDGVNDAPILSKADLSIALSSGSELSQSQADIVLLNGRLDRLITLHRVARQTQRITQQNLTWALAYNLVVLPLAAFGYLTPWLAAIGMSSSSLIVVLNALRIRTTTES